MITPLLIKLNNMYLEGHLATVLEGNKMRNHPDLVSLMAELQEYIPEKLTGAEAALKMRQLSGVDIDEAIEHSDNVIDTRFKFNTKIAENNGASGLVKKLVEYKESGNYEAFSEIYELMSALAKENEK